MDFITVGGDERFAWMAAIARREGMNAGAVGQERAQIPGLLRLTLEDIAKSSVLVMPRGDAAPETLQWANKGSALVLFGSGDAPAPVGKGFAVANMSEDEVLNEALACQTAEGAVHAVCGRKKFAIKGCRILIVGYGRIGQALHKILSGYDADIRVAARRESARCRAENRGAKAVDLREMEELLPSCRMIFSTPPQPVLDERRISLIDKNALVLDLSSAPYGVDMKACAARHLNAWREPGLPGRYCPESAGRAMLDCFRRMTRGGIICAG